MIYFLIDLDVICGLFREGKEFAAASKIRAGTETNANLDHQLYYHFLGSDQSEDILCWRDPDNPKHTFIGSVTEDGKVTISLPILFFF